MRIRNGTASAVNVRPGSSESAVSSRAIGFRRMLKKFQHTVRFPDIVVFLPLELKSARIAA